MKRPKRKIFPYIPESVFDHESWGDIYKFKKESRFRKIVWKTFLIIIFIVFIFLVINVAESKIVIQKCEILKLQSEEFDTFFVTQWQKEMCDYYSFTFAGSKNAPVHVNTMPNGGDGYLERGVWYTNNLGKWKLEVNEIK